jgi:poly-gamma-glutamate synthesis protein (capsule biosynthesis protein)
VVLRRFLASFWTIVLFATLFAGCASTGKLERSDTAFIMIVAVGDNLIHKELISNAATGDGEFNFEPYYRDVRKFVRSADIAFINQETLTAGEEFGYSGYPLFNGPTEIADALVKTGFNVVNQASNHTMDKGEGAVFAVLNYWKKKRGVTVLGIHESEAAREKPAIRTVKGIKIGFLSYTYGLNGLALPKDKPYLVSLIDRPVMAREIDALRPLCDFLVVSMHWGNEYEHTPSRKQEDLAGFLAEHNVDLVIGHHPHVLQPVRWFNRSDGGMMLCFFSLGNFISAQSEHPRMLGGMMRVIISVQKSGNALPQEGAPGKPRIPKLEHNESSEMLPPAILSAELIPLVTHYEQGFKGFKVYPLENYSAAQAELHALNRANNALTVDYFTNLLKTVLDDADSR